MNGTTHVLDQCHETKPQKSHSVHPQSLEHLDLRFWVWIGFRAPHHSTTHCVEVVPLVVHHCPKLHLWNAQRPKYPMYSRSMIIFIMVLYIHLHTMYEKNTCIFEKSSGAAQVILTHLHPLYQMITIHNMYECNLIQI